MSLYGPAHDRDCRMSFNDIMGSPTGSLAAVASIQIRSLETDREECMAKLARRKISLQQPDGQGSCDLEGQMLNACRRLLISRCCLGVKVFRLLVRIRTLLNALQSNASLLAPSRSVSDSNGLQRSPCRADCHCRLFRACLHDHQLHPFQKLLSTRSQVLVRTRIQPCPRSRKPLMCGCTKRGSTKHELSTTTLTNPQINF